MKPYLISEHIRHNLANLPRLVFEVLTSRVRGSCRLRVSSVHFPTESFALCVSVFDIN